MEEVHEDSIYEEELISALNEIKKLTKKNQSLKLLLQKENVKNTKISQDRREAVKLIDDIKI